MTSIRCWYGRSSSPNGFPLSPPPVPITTNPPPPRAPPPAPPSAGADHRRPAHDLRRRVVLRVGALVPHQSGQVRERLLVRVVTQVADATEDVGGHDEVAKRRPSRAASASRGAAHARP